MRDAHAASKSPISVSSFQHRLGEQLATRDRREVGLKLIARPTTTNRRFLTAPNLVVAELLIAVCA